MIDYYVNVLLSSIPVLGTLASLRWGFFMPETHA